ncbi:MAG: esterase family protein [Bacteroidetes bacterium]|nr:esterase family protein [Bacteroidota bacterium]
MKLISFLFFIMLAHFESVGQETRISEVLIHSPSLEGNLLKDSADKYVSVYLPPSYFTDNNRRYPVVYFLHGNRGSARPRNILSLFGQATLPLMDSLIEEKIIREMIIVQPDGRHRFGGCQYANSSVSGNWSDFITKDLVEYIDSNYRTISRPESRGLVGSSMGGRGVLDIVLKFPGIYGVVYAMFPGQMGFQRFGVAGTAMQWRELINSNDPNPTKGYLKRLLGFAVAFSPNPNSPPYFTDFPMSLNGESMKINEEVIQRWAEFDPIEIAAKNADPLLKLNALYFDCGYSDRGLKAIRLLASILSEQNIPHVFEQYEGGHGDPGAKRMKSRVLPVLSQRLVFE